MFPFKATNCMNSTKKTYSIERYDGSEDRSLRAWSAADEYLISAFDALEHQWEQLSIYHDRFGYLACQLHTARPTIIITHKSQENALAANYKANGISALKSNDPLTALPNKTDVVLMKVPKSLGLFQLFLEHIAQNSTDDVVVICAFMTRHFTTNMLEVAGKYFEGVEQSRAVKKARLLTLTKKKPTTPGQLLTESTYKEQVYQQYFGVFSADHIDYATQFFLEHVQIEDGDERILDLASGNGVIGNELLKELPNAEMHLLDDSFLAVASAKLNVQGDKVHHHYANDLSSFEPDSLDLIVTNPPFHFEYEVNIKVPIALFRASHQCLKKGGNLQLVASQHLNYKTHLEPLFADVQVLAEDEKFVVYKCVK